MKGALYELPKTIAKTRNNPLPLPRVENEKFEKEDIDDLQGDEMKIFIPSKVNDFYTRLEVLLGLKLSGHSNTLTEASNLKDEFCKRVEIKNKQQYQNALDKSHTH